jgi:hypothetical protein
VWEWEGYFGPRILTPHLNPQTLTDWPNRAFQGIFPMRKDRVIRRWTAEGFIGKGENKSSQENGESCFGALINRGLIQPLPAEESGGVAGYVVHDLVRELIILTVS